MPQKRGFTQKAIVSGGNGFIGASLIRRLVAMGVEVHALVNQNHQRLNAILPEDRIHVLQNGIGSAVEIVTTVQPDTIFHLAAVYAEPVSAECVLSMLDGNLTLGACLLFAGTQCTRQPVFINTGTYWQFDTDSAYNPNTLYAATKQAFQDILHFYRTRFDTVSVTLILYDTFGEADTRTKLWTGLTTAAPGSVFPLSPGEQSIHLVHIDDTVDAFLLAAKLLHEGRTLEPLYCVLSRERVPLRTLVERLNAVGGLGLDLKWGANPYWPGQILEPWEGSVLPGWNARTEVLPALLEMARKHRSGATSSGTA